MLAAWSDKGSFLSSQSLAFVNKDGTQLLLPSTCGCLIVIVLLYGFLSPLSACYCSCLNRQRRVYLGYSALSPTSHSEPSAWAGPALSLSPQATNTICVPQGLSAAALTSSLVGRL